MFENLDAYTVTMTKKIAGYHHASPFGLDSHQTAPAAYPIYDQTALTAHSHQHYMPPPSNPTGYHYKS